MVQQDGEVRKTEGRQRRVQDHQRLGIGDQGFAPHDVGVALGELPEPPALGAVRAPHRLDLVAPEHRRQLGAVLGSDPGERDGQVVTQAEFGQVSGFHRIPAKGPGQPFAAVEHPVDELVPLLAVLPEQGREAFHRRGFEGNEAVRRERFLDPPEGLAALQGGGGQVVPHPADRPGWRFPHGRRGAY